MVKSLLFKFREDRMSGFEVMANNIMVTNVSTNQVPAAPINIYGMTQTELEVRFHGKGSCFNFVKIG